jgi:urease
VTVHDPICTDSGNLTNALYGSFLPIPSDERFPLDPEELYSPQNAAGAVVCRGEPIRINRGRKRVKLRVTNTGDRPVQVRARESSWNVLAPERAE